MSFSILPRLECTEGKREQEGSGYLEKGQKMWGHCTSSHLDSLGLSSLAGKIRMNIMLPVGGGIVGSAVNDITCGKHCA